MDIGELLKLAASGGSIPVLIWGFLRLTKNYQTSANNARENGINERKEMREQFFHVEQKNRECIEEQTQVLHKIKRELQKLNGKATEGG